MPMVSITVSMATGLQPSALQLACQAGSPSHFREADVTDTVQLLRGLEKISCESL